MNTSALIQKVWNFCHTLKDDGVGYGDYLEQLTYLLFLKMAHEYTQPPYSRATQVPAGFDWAALRTKTGEPLEAQYLATLHKLGQEGGMLGAIFFKAQNKIQDPAKLARLVQMIDAESWVGMDADTKGDLYEGLLQKNAEDTKSGAGQYFTPRAVIRAMVACMQPEPMKTIADPACGTGGFFLGAYNWLTRPGQTLNKKQAAFLRQETFYGNEIVPGTRRLCLMNLFLHNVGDLVGEPTVERADALLTEANLLRPRKDGSWTGFVSAARKITLSAISCLHPCTCRMLHRDVTCPMVILEDRTLGSPERLSRTLSQILSQSKKPPGWVAFASQLTR